jgi:hypothetical protein
MFAKRIYAAFAAVALLTLLCAAAAAAQSGASDNSGAATLEGTWAVSVHLNNPPPGLPEEFTALETYSRGGGMVTTNDIPKGPGQGTWEKNGDGYRVTILFFTFDAGGVRNGSIRVRHNLSLKGKNDYTGRGVADIFDASGNLLVSVPFDSHGQRLASEAP